MGISKETDDLKIWRCDITNDLIETQINEIGEQGPDIVDPKNL